MKSQPPIKVSPRQGAAILLHSEEYRIPKDIISKLTRKIQDGCCVWHNGDKGSPLALPSSKWDVGNSCRYSIKLDDLFGWYAVNSDVAELGRALSA